MKKLNMKKLNMKKIIILLIILIILIAVISIVIFICIKPKEQKEEDTNNQSSTQQEQNKEEPLKEGTIEIASTEDNPIEKDGIEVESLNLHYVGDELEVKSLIKNNTDEELTGYMIEIQLLDHKNNVLTMIAHNSTEKFAPNETEEITNYVTGLKDKEKISEARIANIYKNGALESLHKDFNKIQETFEAKDPSQEEAEQPIEPIVGPTQ